MKTPGNVLAKTCIGKIIHRNIRAQQERIHYRPMNEYFPQVQSAQHATMNTEPGFGLLDLALFILAHAAAGPEARHASKARPASEPECVHGNAARWTKQSKSDRLVTQKVLCRVQSRFQNLWSLPPVSVLQFSRKDTAYRANDLGAQN
jgi:hypothetical protein